MTDRRLALALSALLLALAGCARTPSTPVDASAGGDAGAMPAQATLGDAEVLVSVVPTQRIGEAVARQYGIARARDRALVLVSVRAGDASRRAQVTGQARDLRGVGQRLSFAEVDVGGLVDYVATARVSGPDTLRLELDVAGDDGTRTTLRFSRDIPPP